MALRPTLVDHGWIEHPTTNGIGDCWYTSEFGQIQYNLFVNFSAPKSGWYWMPDMMCPEWGPFPSAERAAAVAEAEGPHVCAAYRKEWEGMQAAMNKYKEAVEEQRLQRKKKRAKRRSKP